MNYLQALILSVIEGLTEFLPISSTGHLIVTSSIMHVPSTEFLKSFEIIIQLGAILAVVVLYWNRLIKDWSINKKVLIAFIPTGIIGFVLYKLIKQFLLDNTYLVAVDLILGGIFLLIFERLPKLQPQRLNLKSLTYKQAVIIGLVQSVSILPGISRAAATIVGGLIMGLDRVSAVEFSFLLAIPTMAAATGLDLVKSSLTFSGYEWTLLTVGFVGSFVVALLAVKYFIRFVEKNNFQIFGVYRIIAGIVFALLH